MVAAESFYPEKFSAGNFLFFSVQIAAFSSTFSSASKNHFSRIFSKQFIRLKNIYFKIKYSVDRVDQKAKLTCRVYFLKFIFSKILLGVPYWWYSKCCTARVLNGYFLYFQNVCRDIRQRGRTGHSIQSCCDTFQVKQKSGIAFLQLAVHYSRQNFAKGNCDCRRDSWMSSGYDRNHRHQGI